VEIGSGKEKILIWSQMHGNETTTSRALCDLLTYLTRSNPKSILKNLHLLIIPQLNPDGARSYSRLNANHVDLNRDAVKLSQPESKALQKIFEGFSPDYCFNLHDQRTVFSAGNTAKPSTISFLSPAFNSKKSVSSSRRKSMLLIASINEMLQKKIPGQVGRYDDRFNLNCVGEAFSKLGKPTLLFEAGHFQNDYSRSISKQIIISSLVKAFNSIINKDFNKKSIDNYYEIPENRESYVDLILKGANVLDENSLFTNQELALQYKEVLENKKVFLQPSYHSYAKKLKVFSHDKIKALNLISSRKFVFREGGNIDISFFLRNKPF
jgi:hypothetical protein